MSSLAAIPVTGGPVPTPQFVAFVEGQVSPTNIVPFLVGRDSMPLPELVSKIGEHYSSMRHQFGRLNGCTDGLDDMRRAYPLASTMFGRNFTAVEKLRKGLLPGRPLKILQCGAGMYNFELMERCVPGARELVRNSYFQADGASYETAELALLAGDGGHVDLVEIDERVARAVAESILRGIIINRQQPFFLNMGRMTSEDFKRDPEGVRALYKSWIGYLKSFVDRAHDRNLGVLDKCDLVSFALRPELRGMVNVCTKDVVNTSIAETYDVVWAMSVISYLAAPLQIDLFLRLAACLPIGDGEGSLGGLMVTDRFDLAPFHEKEFYEHLGELMTMAGMTIVDEFERPLERLGETTVIARRTHQSPWLDAYMARMEQVHIVTKKGT